MKPDSFENDVFRMAATLSLVVTRCIGWGHASWQNDNSRYDQWRQFRVINYNKNRLNSTFVRVTFVLHQEIHGPIYLFVLLTIHYSIIFCSSEMNWRFLDKKNLTSAVKSGPVFYVIHELAPSLLSPCSANQLTRYSDAELLMFSLICVWINDWVNNHEAGDLRRYRAHYDVIVMNAPYLVFNWELMRTMWDYFRRKFRVIKGVILSDPSAGKP